MLFIASLLGLVMPENKCLLVKTASEIALKSDYVRSFFTKKLISAIKLALKRNEIQFESVMKGGGRLFILCSDPQKAQKVLSRISGIHATAISQRFKFSNYAEIEKEVLFFAKRFLKKGDLFALDVRASVTKEFSGKDLENRLGAKVMKEIPGLKVKLKDPEKTIFIEVRKNDFFIYSEQVLGLRGLPLGVEGNVAMLFSGKKEELLSAFLLMHRGCNIFPLVKKPSKEVEKQLQLLVPFNNYREFVITLEKDQKQLVEERNIQAIATPDSKTDSSTFALYEKFDEKQSLVVLRPLLLYPKEAKENLAKLFY